MKTLRFIIVILMLAIMVWLSSCVPFCQAIKHDIENTNLHTPVEFVYFTEDYYDYYENFAKDLLYLWNEYEAWFWEVNDTCNTWIYGDARVRYNWNLSKVEIIKPELDADFIKWVENIKLNNVSHHKH